MNQLTLSVREQAIPEHHLECRIIRQEGAQSIDFVPRSIVLEQPLPWILERVLYVVKMYQHALVEAGQDGKQLVVHIAGGLEDVGGVDEQDVVLFECGERRK